MAWALQVPVSPFRTIQGVIDENSCIGGLSGCVTPTGMTHPPNRGYFGSDLRCPPEISIGRGPGLSRSTICRWRKRDHGSVRVGGIARAGCLPGTVRVDGRLRVVAGGVVFDLHLGAGNASALQVITAAAGPLGAGDLRPCPLQGNLGR